LRQRGRDRQTAEETEQQGEQQATFHGSDLICGKAIGHGYRL